MNIDSSPPPPPPFKLPVLFITTHGEYNVKK